MVPGGSDCAGSVLAPRTMSQPSRARANATARPPPRDEPVTTATSPSSLMAHAFLSANVYHLRTAHGASSFTPLPETDVALRTPLYQTHLAAGARLVEVSGVAMPVQYPGVLQAPAPARERVAALAVSTTR